MKPNNLQMISHIAHHFGMSLGEVAITLKAPTHPAGLRDEFAAFAMQGMLANNRVAADYDITRAAYIYADDMLAARTAKTAPEPAPAADPVPDNTAQWYAELLELLGASSQTEAKYLINGLVAASVDQAEASSLLALYRALGVRDQEAALAKIKELTK